MRELFLKEAPDNLKERYLESPFDISKYWFNEDGTIRSDMKLKNQYIKSSVRYKDGVAIEIKNELMTKENFYKSYNDNTKSLNVGNCGPAYYMTTDCWETNYKILTVIYYTSPANMIGVINQWKTIPSIKSFDSIGLYHNGYYPVTYASGVQYYDGNSILYSYNGTNMNLDSNGVSVSQNIVDTVSSTLSNELWVFGSFNSRIQAFTASYQHAVNNITLDTSKNFYFSGNGMGRVFYWNSSWSNWDNMQGVCGNITPQYLWFC